MSVIGLVGEVEAERCVVHYSPKYQEMVAAEILAKTEVGRRYRIKDVKLEIAPLLPGPWFGKLLCCRAFKKVGKDVYERMDIRLTPVFNDPSRREEWVMENLCRIRNASDLP